MVAIVSGDSLGLLNTSAGVLGKNGLLGQAANGATGEEAVVNVANGNLVLQTSDDTLVGQGLDIDSIRTYNSQGSLNEGNGLAWSMSIIKTVGGLTGTVNTAGSTITRTDGDGNAVVYTYSNGVYVGREGSGTNDTLSYNGTTGTWTWTNGSTNATETYNGSTGYIATASDTSGNTLTYAYNGALLASVTDASGESVQYGYNSSNQLAQVTDYLAGGVKNTRVYYNYDTQGRLSNVTVDLSPGDNSTTDGNTYWTNYTYVGSTSLISSVTQKDGSQLNFSYIQVNGQQNVQSVTDALGRKTTFNYLDTTHTSVTDPNGNTTTYTFDGQGRLTNVAPPAVGGVAPTASYTYYPNGEVKTATDGQGNTSAYSYDGNGNLLSRVDPLGDTVTYTYNSSNLMTSKTAYTVAAQGSTSASGAETTYYLYDSNDQLAYTVSAQGRVTQHLYNYGTYNATTGLGGGDLASTIDYAGDFYPMSGLSATSQPTLAQLNAWVASTATVAQSQRTDYQYDLRSQLRSSTTYTGISSAGATSGANTVTYVYDQAGNLLTTVDGDANHQTSYTYDGLNRQTGKLDANHNSIVTAYNDTGSSLGNSASISVTSAGGLVTLSSFDAEGELTSVTQSGSNIGSNGVLTSSNAYDADGHLLMSTDPQGNSSYYLYDADGRQIASINATGQLTQTNYNADNQVSSVVQYTNLVNTSLLVDSSGQPAKPSLASLLNGNTVYSTSWNIYDNAGRLAYTVDAVGDVTQTNYDGVGNVISTTAYATALTSAQLQSLGASPSVNYAAFVMLAPAATAQDRTTFYYYDSDNLQIGKLDADGYFTKTTRNGAGEVTQTTSYATSVGQAGITATTSQTQGTTETANLNAAPTSNTGAQTATANLNTASTSTTTTTTTNYSPAPNTSAAGVTTTQTTNYNPGLISSAVQTSTSQTSSGSAN
ncbi:MAG TPA: hypothetical protein VF472_04755, partial [Burkholderiaceae bacterium]